MKGYTIYNVVGTCVVRVEEFQKLQEEYEKLKAIVNCLAHADANAVGATQIYINNAIQVMKEIGEE